MSAKLGASKYDFIEQREQSPPPPLDYQLGMNQSFDGHYSGVGLAQAVAELLLHIPSIDPILRTKSAVIHEPMSVPLDHYRDPSRQCEV